MLFLLALSLLPPQMPQRLSTADLQGSQAGPIEPSTRTAPIRHAGTYHFATGTWTRGSNPEEGARKVLYNNSALSGHLDPFASPADLSWTDEGRIPSSTGHSGASADRYIVKGFTMGYCSFYPDPLEYGHIDFYNRYASCTDPLNLTPIASFSLELPGSNSVDTCWIVTFDLEGPDYEFLIDGDADGIFDGTTALDNFGWTLSLNSSPGALLDPVPLLAGDPNNYAYGDGTYYQNSGASSATGLGTLDQFWLSDAAATISNGCYWMEGYTKYQPFSSFYLKMYGDAYEAIPAPFPVIDGEVAVTTEGHLPTDRVLTLVDTRAPYPSSSVDWKAPMFYNQYAASAETWTLGNLGQVFGVCYDYMKPPNIYVAASSSYPDPDEFQSGGAGGVYRIDGLTAEISTFLSTDDPFTTADGVGGIGTNRMPNTGPGLGDICFDSTFGQWFVSNFEDGKIYRVKLEGGSPKIVETYDPFEQLVDAEGFAPLGERVWALAKLGRRLFFSVWSRDEGDVESGTKWRRTAGTTNNAIYSCGIDQTGAFIPNTTQLLFVIDTLPNAEYSNPCSDIAIARSTHGWKFLLAERTMWGDSLPGAHNSRVLLYTSWGSLWSLPHFYQIGQYASQRNASGGADFEHLWDPTTVYATGDTLLVLNPGHPPWVLDDWVYGLQRASILGWGASQFHDMDGIYDYTSAKYMIGDCEVYHKELGRYVRLGYHDDQGGVIHQ